jgi:hypothetical protein
MVKSVIRELTHAALRVDVELSTLRPEVGSVCEPGAPQGAIRGLPEYADSLDPDVVVLEQVRLLLRPQRRHEVLAFARLKPRPGPVDPLVFTHGILFVAAAFEQVSQLLQRAFA